MSASYESLLKIYIFQSVHLFVRSCFIKFIKPQDLSLHVHQGEGGVPHAAGLEHSIRYENTQCWSPSGQASYWERNLIHRSYPTAHGQDGGGVFASERLAGDLLQALRPIRVRDVRVASHLRPGHRLHLLRKIPKHERAHGVHLARAPRARRTVRVSHESFKSVTTSMSCQLRYEPIGSTKLVPA